MLSSEFNQEMGALIRRLEARVRLDPGLQYDGPTSIKAQVEDAIVTLCALHIKLERMTDDLREVW